MTNSARSLLGAVVAISVVAVGLVFATSGIVVAQTAVGMSSSPASIPVPTFTSVDVGRAHSCAVRSDQAVACWGDNDEGQLDIPEGQYTDVAVGDAHSCELRTDQAIACWGDNTSGQADAPEG